MNEEEGYALSRRGVERYPLRELDVDGAGVHPGTRAAKEDAVRRAARIFPRAKARNRGHSSSWEGPRAPRSLPRRFTRGTTKNKTLWGCIGRRCVREARLRASRTGSRLTKIAIPRCARRPVKGRRPLICAWRRRNREIARVTN